MPESATPGLFYHGSRTWGLDRLVSKGEQLTVLANCPFPENWGIYFSKDEHHLVERLTREGGAVYCVELQTKNPLVVEHLDELQFVSHAKKTEYEAAGHDCLICDIGCYDEIVVFDPALVKIVKVIEPFPQRLRTGRQVCEWAEGRLSAANLTGELTALEARLAALPANDASRRALEQKIEAKIATLDEQTGGLISKSLQEQTL